MNQRFNLKQRVAALCMAAVMCCSMFPVGAFAEAPRADADGTLIMEQDKEAVTDDSHQTEASDPDPGEEITPKSSEAAATSQSADEDAPVETSTDYTFDGAVLYTDLPDAPTGSYMGSQGLPVATGETKIGISAWPNDQLEESADSYLSADTLNSDDMTMMAPLLEGTDYAVAPILAQVEYPADGSSLDVVLPNEVTVLDFYGAPAGEATRSSLVHSEYTETSAAVMGLYVQADADFSAQLVYTAPDGSTLTKALHVVIDRSHTMAAPFAETTDIAAYAERPTPAVTSGKITKVEKVNGTWLIWFNGEEAYCCTTVPTASQKAVRRTLIRTLLWSARISAFPVITTATSTASGAVWTSSLWTCCPIRPQFFPQKILKESLFWISATRFTMTPSCG